MKAFKIYTAVFLIFMTACTASGYLSPVEKDIDAKKFYSISSKSRVYIVRKGGFAGSGALTQILVDGRLVSTVGPNNYFVLDLNPGKHIFSYLGTISINSPPYAFELSPGEIYFIEIKHIEGSFALLSQEDGRNAVNIGKRVELIVDPNIL
jgi:hypothetical protein